MALRTGDIIRAVRNADLVITPRLNDHLMQNGDRELSPRVAAIINEQLTTRPRNRSASFSSSSAGRCYREQELGFLGMPQSGAIDPRLQNIFNDGKWRHLRWQAMLLEAGILDKIELPLWWRRMLSRGTIDGRGVVPKDHLRESYRNLEFGFELKGINPYGYQKAVKQDDDMKEEHKRQVARYFLMSGYDLWVTIYENKATNEWFEWVELPDQTYMDEQRDELAELANAIHSERLHPMLPQCKLQTGVFKECAYGGAHGSCISSRNWPNLTKKPKKNKKGKKK